MFNCYLLCIANGWEKNDRMLKSKKYYFIIGIYFLFSIFILIIPYFKNINLNRIASLLFLNFSRFEILGLSKLSIKYIVMFIVFFHITFYQRLSIITENTSYLSMVIHKTYKRKIVKSFVLKNLIEFSKLYFIIMFWIFVFGMGICLINHVEFEIMTFIHILIYIMKYVCFIFIMYTIHQIRSIIKNSSYLSLLFYVLFILFLICDMAFCTSLLTLSNSIMSELIWCVFIMFVTLLLLCIIIYQFLSVKEIYND